MGIPRTFTILGLLLLVGCVDLTPPWQSGKQIYDGAAADGTTRDVASFYEAGGPPAQQDTSVPAMDAPTPSGTDGASDAPPVLGDGAGDPGSGSGGDSFAVSIEIGNLDETGLADVAADVADDGPSDRPSGIDADGRDAVATGTGGAAGGGGKTATGGSSGANGGGGTGGSGSGGIATGGTGTGGTGTGGTGTGGTGTGGGGSGGTGTGGSGSGGTGTGGSGSGGTSGGSDGGADAGARNGAWTKIASGSPQHAFPGVAYDPTLQHAVLFGGTSCAEDAPTNDTWEWDGASWTMVTPIGAVPSARGSIRMAFDSAHGVAIVHGGWAPSDNPQPGTYSYNLTTHTWTSLGTNLLNLGWYALGYDSDAQLVRMFGGNVKLTFYREVRSWDSPTQTWPSATPAGPSARARHTWACDEQRHRFVMFGGFTSWGGTACLAETWEYDPSATTWLQTATATDHPQACDTPPLVYDPKRKVVVLYGYLNGGETWEYDAGTHLWTSIAGANQVGATSGMTMFYDEKLQAVLLVGGCNAGTLQDGTWQYQPPQ